MESDTQPVGLFDQIKKLGQHGAIYGIGSALSRMVSFLMLPLYTHFLSTSDYGILQLISITVEIASVIIGLRLATTVFRFYHEADTLDSKKIVVSTAFIGVIIFSSLLVIPLIMLSKTLAIHLLDGPNQSFFLVIAFVTMVLQLPVNVIMSYIQAKEKSLISVSISLINLFANVSLNIYFVAYAKLGVFGILLSGAIVNAISLCILSPFFIKENGLSFSFHWCKKMLRFSIPLIPSSIASMITHASDRFFIRSYMNLSETGIYSLGYKMGNSIHSFIYVSFSQIWNTRRFSIEKEQDASFIYAKICTYFIFFMSFFGLGISIFAKDVMRVISPAEYSEVANIIPLIVLCYAIYAIEDHVSTGIWLKKKTERITIVTFISAIVNIALNFLLIPRYGMYGAVYSTFFTFIVRDAGLFFFSRKLFPIDFEWGRLASIFILCMMFYVVSLGVIYNNVLIRLCILTIIWILYPLLVILIVFDDREKKGLHEILMRIKKKLIKTNHINKNEGV